MARAMLLAVAFAALASGARYVDYSGVKMPEYNGGAADYEGPRDVPAVPPDEYLDRSPDAPASLDYKYEEDPSGRTGKPASKEIHEREIEDSEIWQSPEKNHKKWPLDDANLDTLDKYSPHEMIPKFKPSSRFSKRGPRLKARSSDNEPDISHKRLTKYIRTRNEDNSDGESEDDFHANREDIRDHKNNNFESRNSHLGYRDTTKVKKARRKPRDRFVKSQSDDDELYNVEHLFRGHSNKKNRKESDYSADNEVIHMTPSDLDRPPQRYIPNVDDIEDLKLKVGKIKPKNYEEYDDYYDMKRVNSIKKKLPTLLRRPTVATSLVPPPLTTSEATRRWEVMPNRRANKPPIFSDAELPPHHKTTTTSTTTTTTSTTTTPTTTTQSVAAKAELSLAEMSRLSILKKALRKESMLNTTSSTKKPPVLLQLASKMQTMVMVEPPSSQMPVFREVSGDTPDRLDQVKRLMRRKMVANAKNIHDLTDNWDEMVCDYIDMSMLEKSPATKCMSSMSVILTILIIYLV